MEQRGIEIMIDEATLLHHILGIFQPQLLFRDLAIRFTILVQLADVVHEVDVCNSIIHRLIQAVEGVCHDVACMFAGNPVLILITFGKNLNQTIDAAYLVHLELLYAVRSVCALQDVCVTLPLTFWHEINLIEAGLIEECYDSLQHFVVKGFLLLIEINFLHLTHILVQILSYSPYTDLSP